MKALSKDPRQRQQSMEELYEELQRCYGSVRYRRSLDVRAAAELPIPLQRVKRPGSGPFSEPIARVTPPEFRTEGIGLGNGPILLTRRKERRKTLPMELPAGAAATPPPPHHRPRPARRRSEEGDWVDMDVDAPDGTGGERPTPQRGARYCLRCALRARATSARDALLVGDPRPAAPAPRGTAPRRGNRDRPRRRPPPPSSRPPTTIAAEPDDHGHEADVDHRPCGRVVAPPCRPSPSPTGRCRRRRRPRRRWPACAAPRRAREQRRDEQRDRDRDGDGTRSGNCTRCAIFHILGRPEAMPSRQRFPLMLPRVRAARSRR